MYFSNLNIIHRIRSSIWLLPSLALINCNQDPTIYVLVDGWADNAVRTRVTTSLHGQPRSDLFLSGRQTRLSVRLPSYAEGDVAIEVAAQDVQDCDVAIGAFTTAVPRGLRSWSEQSVVLSVLPSVKCPPSCTADGWCLQRPLPQGNDLLNVRGTDPQRVWALGSNRSALRWDGMSWAPEIIGSGPLDMSFTGSWGQSAGSIWVVGSGGLLHRLDGNQWSVYETKISSALLGIWGSSPSDVWTVGDSGIALRWDGSKWSSVSTGTSIPLNAIWGTAANDIYAVANNGTVIRWDGTQWRSFGSTSTTSALRSIWGTSSNDIWAAGSTGTLIHWDGFVWNRINLGITSTLNGVWGSGKTDIWVVGDSGLIFHSDGAQWLPVESGTKEHLRSIWGSNPTDLWAVGTSGVMLHWAGNGKLFDGQSCSTAEQCRTDKCTSGICGPIVRGPAVYDSCQIPAAGAVSVNLTPLHCVPTPGQASSGMLTWQRQDRLAIVCTNYSGRALARDGSGSPLGGSTAAILANVYQLVEIGTAGQAQELFFADATSTAQVSSCQVTYRGVSTSVQYINKQLSGLGTSPPPSTALLPGN